MSQLAGLLERVAESIYVRKDESLWALHKTSEAFHEHLQSFAAQHGLGLFARDGQRSNVEAIAIMTLHNGRYHNVEALALMAMAVLTDL